jgi:proteic killer suppression protein
MAKKVNQRMMELRAAANLQVMKTIPAANCHELKGDRQGEFAVDISGNFRLIFEPDHSPVPRKADRSIDCIKVTDIMISDTRDYH